MSRLVVYRGSIGDVVVYGSGSGDGSVIGYGYGSGYDTDNGLEVTSETLTRNN